MIDRLLGHLHGVFGKEPGAAVALRVRHPQTFVWVVADRRLRATTAAGDLLLDTDLAATDFNGLARALQAAGCEIVFRNPDLAGLQADTLISGGSREDASDGDALSAYTSPLWALLDAFAVSLEFADAAIDSAMPQARMHTASGEWLDYWGRHFGIFRGERVLLGGTVGGVETDAEYLRRIVVEVLRPRVNKYAIEAAVLDLAGEDVTLFEPWRNVFILDRSNLSGDDRMHDGRYWTWNVIVPFINGAASARDWSRILRVIERNRPIGTLVLEPNWNADATHAVVDGVDAQVGRTHIRGLDASLAGDIPLGWMVLDDNTFCLNHPAPIIHLHGASPTPQIADATGSRHWDGAWDRRTWLPISGMLVADGCASFSKS